MCVTPTPFFLSLCAFVLLEEIVSVERDRVIDVPFLFLILETSLYRNYHPTLLYVVLIASSCSYKQMDIER